MQHRVDIHMIALNPEQHLVREGPGQERTPEVAVEGAVQSRVFLNPRERLLDRYQEAQAEAWTALVVPIGCLGEVLDYFVAEASPDAPGRRRSDARTRSLTSAQPSHPSGSRSAASRRSSRTRFCQS